MSLGACLIFLKRVIEYCKCIVIKARGMNEFRKMVPGKSTFLKTDICNGKVHVLANGSSLNETLSYIDANDAVISVNWALNDERIKQLKPFCHVMLDPRFADQPDEMKYLLYVWECKKLGIIKNIVINSMIYATWIELTGDDNVIVLNQTSYSDEYNSKRDKYNYEKNNIAPKCQTVMIGALYSAIQFGYDTVFLHGNDFDWIVNTYVDENCHFYLKDKHFYSVKYRDLTEEYGGTFEMELESELLAMKGYKAISEYAKDENVKIFNVSLKSMIDVFEKKNLSVQ